MLSQFPMKHLPNSPDSQDDDRPPVDELSAGKARFRDYTTVLSEFEQDIWVECPQCGRSARSQCLDQRITWRITCIHCSYTRTASRGDRKRTMPWWKTNWWGELRKYGGAVDPLFGLPLWLRVPCCGQVLWAYNGDHLDLLERYIQATLRERQGGKGYHHSIAVRLPRWMKLAKNRESLLKGIHQLKKKVREGK